MKTSMIGMLVWSVLFIANAGVITYVDAESGASGNTYATGGSLADTSWMTTGNKSAADDDDWAQRTSAGNGGSLLQGRSSQGSGAASIPQLTTEITGLANGEYDVYVFFWDVDAAGWNVSAGLTSDSLLTYSDDGLGDTNSTVIASTLSYDVTPMLTEGDRTMYAVNLGSTTVSDEADTINVFVDHLLGDDKNGLQRTWYDGVGYSAIPEPATLGLVGMGAIGLCAVRRRVR